MFKKFKKEESGEVIGYLLILFAVLLLLWMYMPKIKEITFGATENSVSKVDEVTKPIKDTPTPPPDNTLTPPTNPVENLKFCGMTTQDSYYYTKPVGHGTASSPYQISSLQELQWLDNLKFKSEDEWSDILMGNTEVACYAELTNNIEALDTKTWNEGKGFEPIGDDLFGVYPIHLNGNKHTINNLYINKKDESSIGLFSILPPNSIIQNINITNAEIIGSDTTSILSPIVFPNSLIKNVSVSGKVIATKNTGASAGGLVGLNLGMIEDSKAEVNVIGSTTIGGISSSNAGTIHNSISKSTITIHSSQYTDSTAGGFVGLNSGTIQNSKSESIVKGEADNLGGFSGLNDGKINNSLSNSTIEGTNNYIGGFTGTNSGQITKSYATGKITSGRDCVGGFIGTNVEIPTSTTSTVVSNVYSRVDVTGTNKVGSFIGCQDVYGTGKVENVYGTGKLTASGSQINGLIGSYNKGTIINSYWNKETTGISSGIIGGAKTTSQMKNTSTYTDWDFTNIWAIDSTGVINDGFPYLK